MQTSSYELQLNSPRPFFAEVPYYLWGQVNYDSEGNCKSPTDRGWTWLELENRETREQVSITQGADGWTVEGPDPLAARTVCFLMFRCGATGSAPDPMAHVGEWDHAAGLARAAQVQTSFERPELQPFDNGHLFWGSWKWIGWFATEFTWVGRWIMHSVLTSDPRAVSLCIDWLQAGTFAEGQSQALRYALQRFTGRAFPSDAEWMRWYSEGEGQKLYPEPDFNDWLADLKQQFTGLDIAANERE